MRYDDWDVILFPRDSHVPIQEFKTACYNAQDAKGYQLPTLTCYISSLPPSTPFRVSLHSWAATSKPSATIEARRKANQKIMYMVQIIVDGIRVFHSCFEVASRWPQEIAHEKRMVTSTEKSTSQRKLCLQFPPFLQHTLMQTAWDPQDPSGRINIVLSERLICRNGTPGELNLGIANDIVCFSFQHAPKDILEQAGISWPIRNPLCLPNIRSRTYISPGTIESLLGTTNVRCSNRNAHMQSPLLHASTPAFTRPHNAEPLQRPNSHPSPLSHVLNPPLGARCNGRADLWDDSFGSLRDDYGDVSLKSRSIKGNMSNSTGDMCAGNRPFTELQVFTPPIQWANPPMNCQNSVRTEWNDRRSKKGLSREIILKIRDDQLGHSVQALSPPKKHRNLPYGIGNLSCPPNIHAYHPPKSGTLALTTRPSAAALARKSSYTDFTEALRTIPRKLSPSKLHATGYYEDTSISSYPSASSNKENFPPLQSQLPTSITNTNQVPTPNPSISRLSYWNSDILNKEKSSVFPSVNRHKASTASVSLEAYNKHGTTYMPSNVGCVKSRKGGLSQNSPLLSKHRSRHDRNVPPPSRNKHRHTTEDSVNTPYDIPSLPAKPSTAGVEIIDVDAIGASLDSDAPLDNTKLSPSKSNHKLGKASMDSTGCIERQLFNALGEEYGNLSSQIETANMEPELAQALHETAPNSELSGTTLLNPTVSGFELVGKRKRQGTTSGESDRSPMSKKEKGAQIVVEGVEDQNVPRLRSN